MHQHSYGLLLAGIAALLIGPAIYAAAGKRRILTDALDGFVLTSVGGLVVLFVLPGAMAASGGLAIVAALVGMTLPLMMERLMGMASRTAHTIMLASAMVGLFLHTMIDGAALFEGGHTEEAGALAMAVVLHRLPVSLAIWNIAAPRYGKKGALAAYGIVALGTLFGAAAGHQLHDFGTSVAFQLFQALVAGSLLHVVVHRHDHAHGSKKPELFGAILGVAVLLVVPVLMGHNHDHGHDHGEASILERLLELSLEAAPALALGFVLAALLGVRFKRAPVAWLRSGGQGTRALKGMAVGLPLPICSCGVVPVYHSLIRGGVPASAAMAFLVATPEIGIESLILSLPLLGTEMTAWRLGAAALIALLTGIIVGRMVPDRPAPEPESAQTEAVQPMRAFVKSLRSLVDDTAPWIAAGIILAAIIEPSVVSGLLGLPDPIEVVLFAAAGIPIYVCASGATPLAAAFIWAGISPGAALAFLIAGPATNVTTFATLTQLHGRRIAIAFAATVLGAAVAAGIGLNLTGWGGVPAAEHGHDHAHPWWAWASLGLVALVFLDSLARLGPQKWVSSVLTFGHEDHGHGHAHAHGHDHGHHAKFALMRAPRANANLPVSPVKFSVKTTEPPKSCSGCDCGH